MDENELRTIAHMTALEHRFWAKVEIVDDDTSCWEWSAARGPAPDNYWRFQMEGRNVNAHRVALFLQTGAMPVVACHTCDNPPCVRPSHLYDGDTLTNSADRVARGRARGKAEQRGEANDYAILTDALVLDARRRARAGERVTALAAEYGVKHPTLSYAVLGRTWTHLDDVESPVAGRPGGRKIPESEIPAILAALDGGETGRSVAERYGVTPSLVSHLRRHR